MENLAYKKRALISTSARHSKRHISAGSYVTDDRAEQAVDGRLEQALRFCTILDNLYGDVFTIDLGKVHKVSGVVILTWQGEGEGKESILWVRCRGQQWSVENKCLCIALIDCIRFDSVNDDFMSNGSFIYFSAKVQ